jgi:hypothetical protein
MQRYEYESPADQTERGDAPIEVRAVSNHGWEPSNYDHMNIDIPTVTVAAVGVSSNYVVVDAVPETRVLPMEVIAAADLQRVPGAAHPPHGTVVPHDIAPRGAYPRVRGRSRSFWSGFCRGLGKNPQLGGFLGMLLMMGSFSGIVVSAVIINSCHDPHDPCQRAFMGFIPCVAVLLLSSGVVWKFSSHSNLYQIICNRRRIVRADEYFGQIQNMQMRILNHSHCTHLETGGNGRPRGATTYGAHEEYRYRSCVDATEFPEDLDFVGLCLVHFTKTFEFADEGLRRDYEVAIQTFQRAHRQCAHSRDFSTEVKLLGLHESILSYVNKSDVPASIRNGDTGYFMMLTILFGLSWFYYVWFDGIVEDRMLK